MPQRGGMGWEPEGRSRRGDACIHVGDSLCGTAETITILQRNYIPIKSKNKIKPWGKKRNSTNQKNHLLFIKGCYRITWCLCCPPVAVLDPNNLYCLLSSSLVSPSVFCFLCFFSSVHFSGWVVSDSLQTHGLQHSLLGSPVRLPCLLQHHTSKASVLQHSTFFMVQLSHPYMTTGKTITLTRRTFVSKVMSLLFDH